MQGLPYIVHINGSATWRVASPHFPLYEDAFFESPSKIQLFLEAFQDREKEN